MKKAAVYANNYLIFAFENSKGKLVYPFVSEKAADEVRNEMTKAIELAQKEAYNQALNDAANTNQCSERAIIDFKAYISQESILNLKIN